MEAHKHTTDCVLHGPLSFRNHALQLYSHDSMGIVDRLGLGLGLGLRLGLGSERTDP